jgi:fluoride exporter
MTLLLVLLGGAVGAAARYLTDVTVQRAHGSEFPWGTWTVNVVGSFALGLVAPAGPHWLVTLAGTGFCGALTTFSTFGYETVRLAEEGRPSLAVANAAASVAAGLTAAALGWWLGTAF